MIDRSSTIWARSRALGRATGERQLAEIIDQRSAIIDSL
jgi:hypothetical protein